MSEFSPAAQSVLDAYWKSPWDPSLQHEDRYAIAAALRAAADQVVPWETWLGTDETCYAYYRQRCNTRRQLLAIADELEAQ